MRKRATDHLTRPWWASLRSLTLGQGLFTLAGGPG